MAVYRRGLSALAIAAGAFAASLTLAPGRAQACPPGCPSPVHPCCCPSPCPVSDGGKQGIAEQINGWVEDIGEQMGSELPAFDLAASPLSCLSGTGGVEDLQAASDAANLSHVGHGLSPSGFTETPFNATGPTAGLDAMFPIGQAPSAITSAMGEDLSALSSELGFDQIDLGGFDLPSMGGDFSGLGVDTGFTTGSFSQLGDMFPIGEAPGAIFDGMSQDLGALSDQLGLDGMSLDLGGSIGFGDGAIPDFGALSDAMSADLILNGDGTTGGLADLFPSEEAFAQLTDGAAGDLGALGDQLGLDSIDLPLDGGLSALAGPSDDVPQTAGLDALFPVQDGVAAIGNGMSRDLGALTRDLGLASGGDLTDYLAIGDLDGPAPDNRFLRGETETSATGSLQDLFPIQEAPGAISEGMQRDLGALQRDLGIANLLQAGGGQTDTPVTARDIPADAGMPDGMADLAGYFPAHRTGDADGPSLQAFTGVSGIETVEEMQLLADLGRLDGASQSSLVQQAIANDDLDTLLSLGRVARMPGVTSGADLGALDQIVRTSGISGLSGIADVGRANLQDLPIRSVADIAALPSVSQDLGIGNLQQLAGLSPLTSLGGFDSLADVSKIGAMANIPGVSTLTGITAGDPQAAATALAGVASCAGASTPVTSAMIDSAGLVGSFQAIRNAFGGASGRDVSEIRIAPPSLRIPDLGLPDSQKPAVSARVTNATPDLTEIRREIAGHHYAVRRTPDALDQTARNRQDTMKQTATVAYARALQKKWELASRTEAELAALERTAAQAASIADAVRMNSKLRAELNHRIQDFTELLTHALQVGAARAIINDQDRLIQPGMAAESPRPPASVTDSRLAQRNARVQQAAQAREAVRRAVEAHNAVVAAQRVGDHLPRLREIIDEHEVRKRHLYAMEQEIRSLLGDLYKDPAAAWQTLRSDLLSADATGYLDGNRHIAAQTAVRPLIPTLLAQTAMTRYGARIPNPCAVNAAYRRAQEEDTCVPYTDGPLQARAGRDMIQGHYSGYQRYKIDPRLVRPRGKDDQGSSHAEDALYTAMQTYLEARKRKLYWDKSRRGNPDSGGMTTTADLWNELHAHAPECLSAPMATTAANIAARPDMFDISPDCSHRTWSDGALQGALINHLQLGGVDQSVWLINNAAYETQVVHGGREGALAHVAQARDLVDQADPAAMRESGLPGLADDLDAYRSILDTIEADTGAEQNVDLPD